MSEERNLERRNDLAFADKTFPQLELIYLSPIFFGVASTLCELYQKMELRDVRTMRTFQYRVPKPFRHDSRQILHRSLYLNFSTFCLKSISFSFDCVF